MDVYIYQVWKQTKYISIMLAVISIKHEMKYNKPLIKLSYTANETEFKIVIMSTILPVF